MRRPSLPQPIRRRIRARLPVSLLWRGGIDPEFEFWEAFFSTRGGPSQFMQDDFVQRTEPSAPLGEPLIEDRLSQMPPGPIRILDVGAGPATSLGKVVPGRSIEIVGVDPLAPRYAGMLERLGIAVPVPTIQGYAETLKTMFDAESFDVIYARNSLDHTMNPIGALAGMLELLKPHGFIALRHSLREGEAAHYETFHQWNFDLREDGPEIWNPKRRYVLAHALPAEVEESGFDGRWLTIVLRHDSRSRVSGPSTL